jgi:hypothetical protein
LDTAGSVLNVAEGVKSKSRTLLGSWRRGFVMMGPYLALVAAAIDAHGDVARALDAGAVAPAPSAQWCVVQRDGSSDQPACYENLLTCVMAALAHASSCAQRPSPDAMTQRAPKVAPVPRHRAHASSHHKFSLTERDELYREFQKWKER